MRASATPTTSVWYAAAICAATAALSACGSDSPPPTGVTQTRTISVETPVVSLVPGGQQRIAIGVEPEGPTIELHADDVPAGLTVSFEPRVLAPGVKSSVMTIVAGPPVDGAVTIRAASSDGSGFITQGKATVTVSVKCPGYAIPTLCPPFPTGGDLSISGVVRERTADGLKPAQGVSVWAWVQRPTNGYSAGGVLSGSGGVYGFSVLPVSLVVLQAYSAEWDQPCGAALQLTGPGQTVDIEVVATRRPIYDPSPPAPGMTGVVYADGVPVAGARVWFEAPIEVYTATTTTDEQGRYSVCRLPGITSFASVYKDGYAPAYKQLPGSGVTVMDFNLARNQGQ
jgi:hypothetical protein